MIGTGSLDLLRLNRPHETCHLLVLWRIEVLDVVDLPCANIDLSLVHQTLLTA